MHDIRKYLSMCLLGTAALLVGAAPAFAAQAPVNLGTAGNFVILSETGITNVPISKITGDIGTSPITGGAITGLDCVQVTGTIYTVDFGTGPAPCSAQDVTRLSAAVANMLTAFNDAAGRVLPDHIDLNTGHIGGLTLAPGLYKWNSGVDILSDVTLDGGPDDVWIFQIGGVLSQAGATSVILTGGAQAKNIFWQVVSSAGLAGHLEGIVLSATTVTMTAGASVNGRLLAQTAVTLISNTVTQPGSGSGPGPGPSHSSFKASPWIYDPGKACDGIVSAWDFSTGNPAPSLHLTKPCATATNAASGATLKGRGVKGITLTELNFDFQGYCGAGAPRFNVVTNDDVTHFFGCASATQTSLGNGWTHAVWDPTNAAQAFPVINAGQTVKSIHLVFDEMSATGVYIDNISVNNDEYGGPTPSQARKMCKKGGFDNLTDANGNVFKNHKECDRFFKGLINQHHHKHHHGKHHHDGHDHHDKDDHDDGDDD